MKNTSVVIFGGSITCWGVIQGLKNNNLNIYVVSSGASSIGSSSRYVKKNYILKTNESEYLNKVKRIIHDIGLKPKIVIAGDDHALEKLSKGYDELIAISRPTFPPWSILKDVTDKYKLAKISENIGLNSIPTINIHNEYELNEWLETEGTFYKNGFFLKCKDSITFKNKYGTKGLICNSKKEIIDAYKKYDGFLGQLLLQKYITGEIDELVAVLMVLDEDSNVIEYNIQKKVRAGGGRFGSTSLSVTLSNSQLFNQARKLVKHLRCIGPVGIQFKFDEDDQEYKIMEINARFSVGVSLAVGAGDNLPLRMIEHFNGIENTINHNKRIGFLLWNPLTDLRFILSRKFFKDFVNNLSILIKPKIIVPLDFSDLKPFRIQFYSIIRAIIKKIL